jgi:hypothetical protein
MEKPAVIAVVQISQVIARALAQDIGAGRTRPRIRVVGGVAGLSAKGRQVALRGAIVPLTRARARIVVIGADVGIAGQEAVVVKPDAEGAVQRRV